MSEDRQGASKSKPMLNGSEDGLMDFDELPNVFAEHPPQVEGDPWFFPASEDVVGVEHLLAEPKCNNLGVDILSFNSFVHQKCYTIEEISVVDYGSMKIDNDVLDSNIDIPENMEELTDGVSRSTDVMVLDERHVRDTCEDYLLDNEFGDEASEANPVKGPDQENLILKSTTEGSGRLGCGTRICEFSIENIPLLEATSDECSSLLDEMTIHELHEAFTNIFGRETTVTDKQWLKGRLSFGLHNCFESNSGLSHLKCHLIPGECNAIQISPTSDAFSERESSPFTDVFNFKRRPRIRHVKREACVNNDSRVNLSSEVCKVDTGFPELEEKERTYVPKKRLRKPPKRYIEESLEKNTRHQKRRCEIFDAYSKVEILRTGSYKLQRHKRFGTRTLVQKEDPFSGTCIQVPFGEPVPEQEKKKGHHSEACEESRLLGSNVDSNAESFSAESRDGVSDHEYAAGTKDNKSRRKHHIYWSPSEVLKLVEGVSRCGVGRWSEIKKLLFQSSANRTSVDLKDKWRNLLRASCSSLQSKREVQSRRKQGSQAIPKAVQERVRELAAIHPYPRKQSTEASRRATLALSIPSKACDHLVPLANCC